MKLEKYISELLYHVDCVIVPNFGGFITGKISASIVEEKIYPPSKKVSFNSQLAHNDGLLVNHVASVDGISYEAANEKVANEVANWRTQLENGSLTITSVGTLTYNEEKQLVFEPNNATNFSIDAFGFAPVEATAIERFKQEVKPLSLIHI